MVSSLESVWMEVNLLEAAAQGSEVSSDPLPVRPYTCQYPERVERMMSLLQYLPAEMNVQI
ncbi:hypothetical protein PI125_g2670 [Phytophthora idaei]|nr:hypothetical protein PI125_g2670 [Phytophthora idaei]